MAWGEYNQNTKQNIASLAGGISHPQQENKNMNVVGGMGGAMTGAKFGTMIGGPVGSVIGGIVGGLAGLFGG